MLKKETRHQQIALHADMGEQSNGSDEVLLPPGKADTVFLHGNAAYALVFAHRIHDKLPGQDNASAPTEWQRPTPTFPCAAKLRNNTK